MKTRALTIFGLLGLIVALPLALKRETAQGKARGADDVLVVLTPHNESIRQEVGEAFAAAWKQRTGRSLYLDWRSPGGTSEIRMVLDAGFKAADESGREGIGVDLFFGGGEPDFAEQARKGRLAKLEVFETRPDWFGPDGQIPSMHTGERLYDDDHRWVGSCLSQFGICHNPGVLARLGLKAPERWDDLGDPRYRGLIALSDPTKSGSVARSFELVVQDQMQRVLKEPGIGRDEALAAGWRNGLQLIQRMAGNARYFTDSASRIAHEVGQGNAAAGMCIDLYGKSFSADLRTRDGKPRVIWRPPVGGTTVSADPVAVLRGAPNPRIAQAFVEFCLSPECQRLWYLEPGVSGGPRYRALHRLSIRRDQYEGAPGTDEAGQPRVNPYTAGDLLTYDRELTGKAFNTLRRVVRVMCIDSHEEMKAAWRALAEAGMPADALAVYQDVSMLPYEVAGKGDPGLNHADPLVAERRATELGNAFRANYRRAEAMARQHARSAKR